MPKREDIERFKGRLKLIADEAKEKKAEGLDDEDVTYPEDSENLLPIIELDEDFSFDRKKEETLDEGLDSSLDSSKEGVGPGSDFFDLDSFITEEEEPLFHRETASFVENFAQRPESSDDFEPLAEIPSSQEPQERAEISDDFADLSSAKIAALSADELSLDEDEFSLNQALAEEKPQEADSQLESDEDLIEDSQFSDFDFSLDSLIDSSQEESSLEKPSESSSDQGSLGEETPDLPDQDDLVFGISDLEAELKEIPDVSQDFPSGQEAVQEEQNSFKSSSSEDPFFEDLDTLFEAKSPEQISRESTTDDDFFLINDLEFEPGLPDSDGLEISHDDEEPSSGPIVYEKVTAEKEMDGDLSKPPEAVLLRPFGDVEPTVFDNDQSFSLDGLSLDDDLDFPQEQVKQTSKKVPIEETSQKKASPQEEPSLEELSIQNQDSPKGFGEDLQGEEPSSESAFVDPSSSLEEKAEEFTLHALSDDVFEKKSSASLSSTEDDPEDTQENIYFSGEHFNIIRQRLQTYPHNLKIALLEILSNENTSQAHLRLLSDMIIRNYSHSDLARAAGDFLGRAILFSQSYYRAVEEERKRRSFYKNVSQIFFPIFRRSLILSSLVGSLILIFFFFFWKPIQARAYYFEGLDALYAGDSEMANSLFRKAYFVDHSNEWFFRYARAYTEQRDFDNAAQKYEELLSLFPYRPSFFATRFKNFNKSGFLEYAQLERQRGQYQKAVELARNILVKDLQDRDAILFIGDTYMQWAQLGRPDLHKEAYSIYRRYWSYYGSELPILFRFLEYYRVMDRFSEAMTFHQAIQAKEDRHVEEKIYIDYVAYLLKKQEEYGRYHTEQNRIIQENIYADGQQVLLNRQYGAIITPVQRDFSNTEIRKILTQVLGQNPSNVWGHYYFSEFFAQNNELLHQKKALEQVLKFLSGNNLNNLEEDFYLKIMAHKKLGENYQKSNEIHVAQVHYQQAIEFFENARRLRFLVDHELSSQLYKDQADIYYYRGETENASFFYEKAYQEGLVSTEMRYNMANLAYIRQDFSEAQKHFSWLEEQAGLRTNWNVLYSLGVVSYSSGMYQVARAYYLHLLENLLRIRDNINLGYDELFSLQVPTKRWYFQYLMQTLNNLGVTELALANGNVDDDLYVVGLSRLAEATEMENFIKNNGLTRHEILRGPATFNLDKIWDNTTSSENRYIYPHLPRFLYERSLDFE